MKHLIETTLRFLLIAVILANAVISTPVMAQGPQPGPVAGPALQSPRRGSNIEGMTLGSPDDFSAGPLQTPANSVPDFAAQLAAQEQAQPAPVAPLRLQVSLTPAIFVPGHPITLSWVAAGLGQNPGRNAQVSIQVPPGVLPVDAGLRASMSRDGNAGSVLAIPANDVNGHVQWSVDASAKFPLVFSLALLADGKEADRAAALIDKGKYELGAGGGMVSAANGSMIETAGGQVKIIVPGGAASQPMSFDVRDPSPQQLPPVSLTGYPVEILAVGKTGSVPVTCDDKK